MRILLLGGVKSGKSSWALRWAENFPPPKLFIATAEPLDEEMKIRIEKHKRERGPQWQTLEVPLDLAPSLLEAQNYGICVVDCLTLWLGNLFYYKRNISEEIDRLIYTLHSIKGNFVFISNEIGWGLVPENPLGREYSEFLGILNQKVAQICEKVFLVVAGHLLPLQKEP